MCFEQQNSLWSTPVLFACSSQPTSHAPSSVGRGVAGSSCRDSWGWAQCSNTCLLPFPCAFCTGARLQTNTSKRLKTCQTSSFLVGHGMPAQCSTVSPLQRDKGLAVASVCGFSKIMLHHHFQQSPSPTSRKTQSFVFVFF